MRQQQCAWMMFAAAASIGSSLGCSSRECSHLTDCPSAQVCTSDGVCVTDERALVVAGASMTRYGDASASAPSELQTGSGLLDGVIVGTPVDTTTPTVEGTSDGYVAWTVTTTASDGSLVGLWFDIPDPSILNDGAPTVFTVEEMFENGSLPCVNLWTVDEQAGATAGDWAYDYTITVTPAEEQGRVTIDIDATNTNSDVVATIDVPEFG